MGGHSYNYFDILLDIHLVPSSICEKNGYFKGPILDSKRVKLCLYAKNAAQVVIEITSKDFPYILFGQYSK